MTCGPGTFYNPTTNQCATVITCGPGTFYNSVANQCEIAEIVCGPINGRRMATEVPLDIADSADDAQILADHVLDVVSSYLEKHAEVEKLRSQLKQLFGQPALA